MDLADFVTQTEFAELGGSKRHTVDQWRRRYRPGGLAPEFPAPAAAIDGGRCLLYARDEVITWLCATGRMAEPRGGVSFVIENPDPEAVALAFGQEIEPDTMDVDLSAPVVSEYARLDAEGPTECVFGADE